MSFFMPGKFHPGMRSSFPRRRKFSRQNRFRRRRRFSRFPNQLVRSTIVRQLQPEVKFRTATGVNNDIDDAAVLTLDVVTLIAEGVTSTTRIGRKIQPISLSVRYQLVGQGAPGDYIVAGSVAVVQFKSSIDSGAAGVSTDYYLLPTDPYSQLVQHVNRTWRTLHRGMFTIASRQHSSILNSSGTQDINIARQRILPITYSGPLVADVDVGQILIFVNSAVPAAQLSGMSIQWTIKLSYIDL